MEKRKREGYVMGFFFLVFLAGFVSAPHDESSENHCSVVPTSSCDGSVSGNYPVLRFSDTHAEVWNESRSDEIYNNTLCCNFGGSDEMRVCLPGNINKIVGLSSVTNAHAEIKRFSNYSHGVCYGGDVQCWMRFVNTTTRNCSSQYRQFPKEFLSLSNDSAAHVGPPEKYRERTICCKHKDKQGLHCALNNSWWSASSVGDGRPIAEGENVSLYVRGESVSVCLDEKILFEIFQNGTDSSEPLFSFNGTYPVASWKSVRVEDTRDGEDDNPEYYFKATVYSTESYSKADQLLEVKPSICNIAACSGYVSEGACNSDVCNVAKADDYFHRYSCTWRGDTSGGLFPCWEENIDRPVCGDGVVQKPNEHGQIEFCDTNDLNGTTCQDLGYGGGTLSCRVQRNNFGCTFNVSGCHSPPTSSLCGNGFIDVNETCDGNNLGRTNSCSSLGANLTGALKCFPPGHVFECQHNANECRDNNANVPFCGDGAVNQPWEQCDDGNRNRTDSCDPVTCKNVVSGTFCGDGAVNQPWEECDNGLSNSYDGECNFLCKTQAGEEFCGDGAVNQPWEQCDDDNTRRGDGCGANCLVETSSETCGDGLIQKPNDAGLNEQCDLTNLSTTSCTSLNGTLYSGGNLKCKRDCTYDVSSCVNLLSLSCGDGVRNRASEECDGEDLQAQSCKSAGYRDGALRCGASCGFDFGDCEGEERPVVPANFTAGTCLRNQRFTLNDDCDDGFLSYTYVSLWQGRGPPPNNCRNITSILECPPQLELPFFSLPNVLTATAVMVFVYVFVILSRRKFRQGKS